MKELERDLNKFKDTAGRSMATSARVRLERRVLPEMKSKIVQKDAVASTELFRSFRISTGVLGGDDYVVRLTNFAPHAPYVEFGTGGYSRAAGRIRYGIDFDSPPYSPGLIHGIRTWMYAKPSFTDARPGLEFAIAGAIAFGGTDRFGRSRPPGTPASPFFFNTWFEQSHDFRRAMDNAFGRKVERTFRG